ncbi:MAG: tetratricopeptide repeat protein [Chitinophagaceae bacterium]
MSDPQEYIEAYFSKELDDIEKAHFEERCSNDPVFAKEVAFYITSREAVRQMLLEQKQKEWQENEHGGKVRTITSLKRRTPARWLPYAAAACIIFAAGLFLMNSSGTPQKLANQYVKENFNVLSQTMDASEDSLQQGIAAYNNKDYDRALQIFQKIGQSDPGHGNAKKFIGYVYLVTKDYDKALQQFDELARMKDLYKNPGLFLKAITLLQKNGQQDKMQAKRLLERIISENAEGSKEASIWLEKW